MLDQSRVEGQAARGRRVDPSLCSGFRAKLAAVTKTVARTAPLVGLLALAGVTAFATDALPPDPLAAEIARWKAFAASPGHSGEIWDSVRQGGEPLLLRAEQALADGRRLLALQRLAAAREGFYAARYLYGLGAAERQDPARFEAEWRRIGEQLKAELAPPAADTLSGVGPGRGARDRRSGAAAGARLLRREPRLRAQHRADSGLFYIGRSPRAARLRRPGAHLLGSGRRRAAPAVARARARRARDGAARGLPAARLDRPPLRLHRARARRSRRRASSTRPACATGLCSATCRRPSASRRCGVLRPAPGTALEARLRAYDARLASRERDDTIGRLFLETAQSLAGAGKRPAIRPWRSGSPTDVLPTLLRGARAPEARGEGARAARRR